MSNLRITSAALAAAALSFGGCGIDADLNTAEETDLNNGIDNSDENNNNNEQIADLTLRGFVRAPNGMGLADVLVSVVNDADETEWTTTTSPSGTFALPDLADGQSVVMRFELDGYAPTNAAYTAIDGGLNFFSHTLAPVDLMTEFPAADGLTFEIDGTHAFEILGNTVTYLDGTPYSGTVGLQATVWDRTTPLDEGGEFLASPGNGQGTMTDGSSHLLYTMGMFQLAMSDDDGTPLQAGPGFQMQVEVPANSNLEPGDQVPYWSYNTTQNTWNETDAGEIVDLGNGQQVWQYEPTQGLPARTTTGMVTGNPDHPIIVQVSAQAQGQVTDQMGEPQPGATVRVISEDLTYMQQAVTDSNGFFSVNIPPVVASPAGPNGRPVFFEVDYTVANKPSLYRTDAMPAPGPNGVLQFGEAALGSMSCVSGRVVDTSGAGVSDVDVLSPHGGNGRTDANGNFEMDVPKWQPSTLYVGTTDNGTVGFEPMVFRPRPDQAEGTCPNGVTLLQYDAVSCASGEVTVAGFMGEGLIVDAFDARHPNAPIFSTTVEAGTYCVTVPTEYDTVVRVGAGDLAEGNSCGSHGVYARNSGTAACAGDSCEAIPSFDCGI